MIALDTISMPKDRVAVPLDDRAARVMPVFSFFSCEIMLPNSNALVFTLGTTIVLLTPGPTNTLLATAGLRQGIRRSAKLTLAELGGYVMAITLWGRFITGAAHSLTWLPPVLRIACSLYIAYLAVCMWRAAASTDPSEQQPVSFLTLFIATLLNPKAIIFAGTIFPALAFASLPDYFEVMAIFIVLLIPIGFVWLAFGAGLGANRITWASPERVQRSASVVLGSFSLWLVCAALR